MKKNVVRCKERVSFSDLPFFAINCFNMIEQFLVTGFLTHMGRGLSIISCSPGKRSINKSIEFPVSNLIGAQIAQTVEECGRLLHNE